MHIHWLTVSGAHQVKYCVSQWLFTGDQALTACHVASQVHFITKPALILGPA